MRLASSDQIPFLEPHEDEDKLVRQHLASNNNTNDESLPVNIASPSKPNKRRRNQQQQQHENNRNVISYQDLDRPDEQRDATLDNRLVPKSNKTNQLPSDKTNNHYPTKAPPVGNDQALKLELDRIKKAGAQEREKLRAQRQAAAERERETHMKRNSAGDPDKREDGELGDSSDDENSKSTAPVEHKRSKKAVESESILDMSVMKLMRPMKLFHLDDEPNSSYRAYLTTHFGRVRVHCQKPQPNFFSNLSCIEELKRRLRLNQHSSSSTSLLFQHMIDESDHDPLSGLTLPAETEDGEIESEDESTSGVNGKATKQKSSRALSDDDNERQSKKRSKFVDDPTMDVSKSSLNDKPW